ncbi:flagellar assembly protein FliX [Sphingomonas psychrotolerans]|uniref:Flagellar assembly protein FliX n=1 Tax=Sphingomonas psychrotolerans TaxID=1327635 RepID=A0ABU3MYI3_9SPHN|nr:flagellar assembly protein FliX [Sphingomonas psychrotolerans]MDT8757071.1 flagellar assembly protein FliX [Sphingomonas psychrotolerans]
MRIDNLTPLMARSLLAALPKVAPGFPIAEEQVPARPTPMQGPGTNQPVPSVAMLVTLAAADPAIERRRKQAVHAERGLDALDRLRKELATGTPSVERLREIVEWSENFETSEDPVLAGILSDIELRVRVELAKIDVSA